MSINKTTDELLHIVDEAMEDAVTEKQLAEIVSMGEMTSVRIFASAIESLGVKSEYIDPFMDQWPIITDNNLLSAKVDFKATEDKSLELMKMMDQGIIPVVCGFLRKRSSRLHNYFRKGRK